MAKLADGSSPKLYIETYGCQMNVLDTEVVLSVLQQQGYTLTNDHNEADLVLINTCSIRENAEQRVRGRLDVFRVAKKKRPGMRIGIIGCMAERLKEQLLEQEKMVDMVVGPDAYRDLPNLLENMGAGQKAVNVILSQEETYADISPVRMDANHISAFVAIMRGCNNYCSYCVVPYVRGRERSRDIMTILQEIKDLSDAGYREVTLIGQNVNSYRWKDAANGGIIDFPVLLEQVAENNTNMRIRYSTSHPKDLSDELLLVMKKHDNICKNIHLPLQSGSTKILKQMNRGYTQEWYKNRINAIKSILPDCSVSTDIIAGFCTETDEDHKETLKIMEWAGYDFAYMFKYSERPGTKAADKLKDDVPEEIKSKRLKEIIELQNKLSLKSKKQDIGKVFEILVEGVSKRSKDELFGRNSQNKVVVFPKEDIQIGDFVNVIIKKSSSATLKGEIIR